MEWDQPYYTMGGVTNSVSLYVLNDANGALITSSTSNATTTNLPFQFVGVQFNGTGTTKIDIVMSLSVGSAPGRIKWVNFGANGFGDVPIQFATNSSTLNPHAGAADAMAVAAAPFYSQKTPEGFTSSGPFTEIFIAPTAPAWPARWCGPSPTSSPPTAPVIRSSVRHRPSRVSSSFAPRRRRPTRRPSRPSTCRPTPVPPRPRFTPP